MNSFLARTPADKPSKLVAFASTVPVLFGQSTSNSNWVTLVSASPRHYFLKCGLGERNARQFGSGALDSEDIALAEVDYGLICRHHYCSVWYLSDELREEATIEAADSLLFSNQEQRLPERTITASLLTETCPSDFYKNSNSG